MADDAAKTESAPRPFWHWVYLALATLAGGLGLVMAILGVWLISLGGAFYYLLAGVALTAGAFLAWRNRDGLALGLFAAVLGATIIWSLVEIGGKGWLPAWGIDLAGRAGLLAALMAAIALAYLMWRAPPGTAPRGFALAAVLVAAIAVAAVLVVYWERTEAPEGETGPFAGAPSGAGAIEDAGADWTAYGGTNAGRRYSSLRQITTANIGDLAEAWTFRSRDLNPSEGRVFFSSQNTPIKVGDYLYTCTPTYKVFALDPGTGDVRWSYYPRVPVDTTAMCLPPGASLSGRISAWNMLMLQPLL